VNISRYISTDKLITLVLFLSYPIIARIGVPGAKAIESCLFILAFLYYFRRRQFRITTFCLPINIWLILTLYHWVNAMVKQVPGTNIIDLLHGLKVYSTLAIYTYLSTIDFKKTVKLLLHVFMSYLVLSFFVNDIFHSNIGDRMSGVIYSTLLGQSAAVTAVYIVYLSYFQNWKFTKLVFLYSLPFLVIMLTKSRNALGMFGIALIAHLSIFLLKSKISIKKLILISSLLIILGLSAKYVISNSSIGDRLMDVERAEKINANNGRLTNTYFDSIAGDRLVFYILGFKYFLESPITGIGMWNFRYKSGRFDPLHSEYMVHLCEGGIIAVILWSIFILIVIKGILKSKYYLPVKTIALFSIALLLFCGIYGRLFFSPVFYPLIGLAISLKKKHKYS